MTASTTRTLHLHLIEAMERRASGHDGEVRRILDERLSTLRGMPARELADEARRAGNDTPFARDRGALGGLVDHLTSHAAPGSSSFPELPALDEFRKIWSAVRTESQLRQSLEHVPENAGPLNSSALVHRSIELMRELSPGYLRQFLSYVDDLSWLERMGDGGALAARDAPQAASIGKRPRAKPRGRR